MLVVPRLKQVDHVKNEKNILKARRGSSNRGGGAVFPTLVSIFRSVRFKIFGRLGKKILILGDYNICVRN